MTMGSRLDGMDSDADFTDSILSEEWIRADSSERKMAILLFDAFARCDENAALMGCPAIGKTTIEGEFSLLEIARILIPS